MIDPTKTLTARAIAVRGSNVRFNKIKGVIRKSIVNAGILSNAEVADKNKFRFLNDAGKLREFELWLNQQVNLEILANKNSEIGLKSNWLNVYIANAYAKGAIKTRNVFRKSFDLPELNVFANKAHVDRAELLYTRVFSQLAGITKIMEHKIARVLADNMLQGKSVNAIAKELNSVVDGIGKVRSRLLARTEIVNAHNVGSIREAENLEGILGEEVKMQWLTALDGRERETHRLRHKKTYTKEKALELSGEPNCRCSVSAWLPDFDDDAKLAT